MQLAAANCGERDQSLHSKQRRIKDTNVLGGKLKKNINAQDTDTG